LPAGFAIAFIALLLFHPGAGGTPARALSYTSFVGEVTANKVSTAAITSAGSVSGKLHDGGAYTSQIPIALNDNALSALLLGHKVQVTGVSPSMTSVLGLLLEWVLPLLLFVWLFVWISRRSSKHLGRFGGIMSFGKSKAKVSSFAGMFVGVGASRVRDLFTDARKRAPSIIFIDEIDAIGGRRGPGGFGSNDECEQTLNQLLSEMDGFEPGARVVVMAATNRAEILDAALLRPGRFDRTVEIPLPNYVERTAILAIHGRGKTLAPDVDFDVVSRGTPGFSGADLANLVNEAAINAVRADRRVLSAADFDTARDRLLIGRRDASNALLPEEKHAVAVHEAGHALVAALSEHADPVAKVTILSGAPLSA
jgi:ATP-dependent Zn protease